jgi:hypothetical protein
MYVCMYACMYKRNIETLSCNRLCRGKAGSITHYEGVFLALGIQHAKAYAILYFRL